MMPHPIADKSGGRAFLVCYDIAKNLCGQCAGKGANYGSKNYGSSCREPSSGEI